MHEWPVQEQAAVRAQQPSSAIKEILRHAPRGDVQHVDAEYGCEVTAGVFAFLPVPVGNGEINALRRAYIWKLFVLPPGGDAVEVRRKNVAWPPKQLRGTARERDRMLSGTATELQHVSLLRAPKWRNPRPDSVMGAMKCGCIQPPVRRRRCSSFCKVDNEFNHGCSRMHCVAH